MMKKRFFSVAIAVIMLCSIFGCVFAINNTNNTSTMTIYVSLSGDDSNNGLTPETSKRTIQNAINTVANGGTVIVKNGIYKENLEIQKNVYLIGENKKNTIIDGKQIKSCIWIHNDDSKKSCNVIIEKFTIQNGVGRGIVIGHRDHNVVIKDSIITKNTGGGIRIEYGTKLKLQNTIITKNTANYGGGIYINEIYEGNLCVLDVSDSIISENKAENSGGGIHGTSCRNITVTNSNITDNKANFGGGLHIYGSLNMSDSLIADNVASVCGGGIDSGAGLYVTGTSIIGNKAFRGGGIFNDGLGHINSSVIKENSATYGGGIYNDNRAKLYLEGLKITGNSAGSGGGIYNDYFGTVNMKNTKIQHNNAWYYGGGIYNENLVFIDKLTRISGNRWYDLSGEPLRSMETGDIIKI